jgi:hypothetical protein
MDSMLAHTIENATKTTGVWDLQLLAAYERKSRTVSSSHGVSEKVLKAR